MTDSKAEAHARVLRALEHVEEAQRELGRASAELSSITGGASVDWGRLRKLYDRVHSEWYRIKGRLDKFGHRYDLDSAAMMALREREQGGAS